MKMKFLINAIFFLIELSKIAYIQSRTAGDVCTLLEIYFEDFEQIRLSDLFADLINRFDSPFQRETVCHEYHSLRQKQQELATFLGDFRRLVCKIDVQEENQIVDLHDKIQDDLKQVIILRHYQTIQEMITDLTYDEMNYYYIFSNKSIAGSIQQQKSSNISTSEKSPVSELIEKKKKSMKRSYVRRDSADMKCFNCNEYGHFVNICPKKKKTEKQQEKEISTTKIS